MANVKLIFQGTKKSNTSGTELECFWNKQNEVTISINDNGDLYPTMISLDVSTAIKLSKTLRTAINEAKEALND